MNHLYLVLSGVLLTAVSFFLPVSISMSSASVFLTASTFMFAILAGFFISRQNSRYNDIRSAVAEFDGNISAIYRSFETLDTEAQKQSGMIIKRHYETILKLKDWSFHFTHKSDTIKNLGNLLTATGGNKRYSSVKNQTVNHIIASLDSLQVVRKKMVSLQVERVPTSEWVLILLLALLLLFSLLLIPSHSLLVDSVMKGILGSLIIQVVILLYELDTLKLFESTLGESSARDILDIITGRK